MPKVIQNVSRGQIFEILGGFDRSPIFYDFLSDPKNEKKGEQTRRMCEKAGSPKSFWSLQINKKSSEFANASGTPCPLRARGGGYLWATASSADLRTLLDVLLCLCVWVYAIVRLWGCEFVCGRVC